ncbi:MAG: ferrous iron transport protein B [Clostridiales Family XIII bacterium]|jgi:ferrous iron transport protein B|nr:ferrous iron transport protein B [Clostridiales Family XIII bacterium]
MEITIALAGNPNSGKTTLFNALTGSSQRVGNWPGVTVDKKVGKLKKYKDVAVIDLPGVYSLSPYTLEEVVSRDFLINEKPDAVINLVDGTNIERNLFLTTQLLDVGIPVVVALNMMDAVKKAGDRIDTEKLSGLLGCPVAEISALRGDGLSDLARIAVETAQAQSKTTKSAEASLAAAPAVSGGRFSEPTETALRALAELIRAYTSPETRRWYAIKLFERDEKALALLGLPATVAAEAEGLIALCEETLDDSSESIITGEAYVYVSRITDACVEKVQVEMSASDKIDAIVTNRWLGIPVFVAAMFVVYFVSVTTVGTFVTDFTNDMVIGGGIQAPLAEFLLSVGTAEWLTGLVVDGIVGGVGAVVGFLPQLLILFFFLAILEDCGYMARVAFLMDRVFRKFGLSGKSFIPLLIGTGCGVPGIMAARTIEQRRDRRMTIITTTFMPCGAKLPMIALIAGALLQNAWWVAPSAYFLGFASVVVTGVMLKKTKPFAGDPAPFVMELPPYHFPTASNIGHSMLERASAFAKKAATVYTLASILVWFASSFGFDGDGAFGMAQDLNSSVLYYIGNSFAWIFSPLGFGDWQPAVASVMGLAAKEDVVAVFGILTSIGDADAAFSLAETADMAALAPVAALFSGPLAAYAFLAFNLLCAPCFAAMNTIRQEMRNPRWTLAAIGYECGFAYVVALLIYQFGCFFGGRGFTAGTAAACVLLAALLFLMFRPAPKYKKEHPHAASHS